MKKIPFLIFCILLSKNSFADPIFKVTKIDCIPEAKYFVIYSDILGDGFSPSDENLLKEKYSLFYGDFSYECKIGTRNIKLIAGGLENEKSQFSKTESIKGGIIDIFVDDMLVYSGNDFINYNKVVNATEIYRFNFLSDSKLLDRVFIQHCFKYECNWIENKILEEINDPDKN